MVDAEAEGLWDRLRRRKVVQWGIAYAAGAWGLLQGLAYATATFHWPEVLQALATLALLVGLPIILVIAWYHGDKGHQRVTAAELAIITLLFLVGGAMFWRYDRSSETDAGATTARTNSAAGAHDDGSPAAGNSIAVLLFVNMSKDADNEYFSDGISEEILNSLAQIPDLRVAARTSSFSFKGQAKEVPDIARELKVRMVLEGSVRKQGDRVRITAQLIDADKGFHVWSQTYDRELKDIFAIQDEIAHAIANALQVKLGAIHGAGPARPDTTNLAAYDLYLKGLSLWQARGQANLDQAEHLFEKATVLDPKFAKAWAGIALVEALRPDWFGTPDSVAFTLARNAAEHALALDPTLPEAYAALGTTAYYEGRWANGRVLMERAITIAPSYATAWQWYGFGLSISGATEESLPVSSRAVELDPKSPIVRSEDVGNLRRAGRDAEAEAECAELVSDPGVGPFCLSNMFMAQMARKDYVAARATLQQLAAPRGAASLSFVNQLMDAVERKIDPRPIASRLATMGDGYLDKAQISPMDNFATIYWFIAAGVPDHALARLKAVADRAPSQARQLIDDPPLDSLRCGPEFAGIVRQLGSGDSRAAKVCGAAATAAK
jgi:TolB-like protein/Flp pilus assembly protein TadD